MHDSPLCKVYSSEETLRFRTSWLWKYRRSKSALAGILTQMGWVPKTKPKKYNFSLLRIRKRSGHFDLGFFRVLIRGNFERLLFWRPLLPRSPVHAQSVFFFFGQNYMVTGDSLRRLKCFLSFLASWEEDFVAHRSCLFRFPRGHAWILGLTKTKFAYSVVCKGIEVYKTNA